MVFIRYNNHGFMGFRRATIMFVVSWQLAMYIKYDNFNKCILHIKIGNCGCEISLIFNSNKTLDKNSTCTFHRQSATLYIVKLGGIHIKNILDILNSNKTLDKNLTCTFHRQSAIL